MARDCKHLIKFITYPHETSVFKVCESEMIASEKYLKDE